MTHTSLTAIRKSPHSHKLKPRPHSPAPEKLSTTMAPRAPSKTGASLGTTPGHRRRASSIIEPPADTVTNNRRGSRGRSTSSDAPSSSKKIERRAEIGPIPTTVFSGFLGSGKTTLLKRILQNQQGKRIAVLVNDITEISIDAELVKTRDAAKSRVKFTSATESVVELNNGCICCTLREDLIKAVSELARVKPRFDYILIEGTGIAEPLPVAQTFTVDAVGEGEEQPLSSLARLDTLVTVVDASRFEEYTRSNQRLIDRDWTSDKSDERHISDLLIDQVEFANVLVLNKVDLVKSSDKLNRIEGMLRTLNPSARIVRTTRCKELPLELILDSKAFDMEEASKGAGWIRELEQEHHTPETEEYGITSWTLKDVRPFDARKFCRLFLNNPRRLQDEFNVIRSKGFFWLAQDDRFRLEYASAGPNVTLDLNQIWESAAYSAESLSSSASKRDQQLKGLISDRKTRGIGERRTEFVFMGINMKLDALKQAVEEALLDDAQFAKVKECVWAMRAPTKRSLGGRLWGSFFAAVYEQLNLAGDQRDALLLDEDALAEAAAADEDEEQYDDDDEEAEDVPMMTCAISPATQTATRNESSSSRPSFSTKRRRN